MVDKFCKMFMFSLENIWLNKRTNTILNVCLCSLMKYPKQDTIHSGMFSQLKSIEFKKLF